MMRATTTTTMATSSTTTITILFFLLPILILTSAAAAPNMNSIPITLWPHPSLVLWPTPTSSPLSPLFRILSPLPLHPYLQPSISRYSTLLFSENYRPIVPPSPLNFSLFPPVTSLSLSISDPSAPLSPSSDESYTLSLPLSSPSALLSSPSVWGALRGLETFLQLTWGRPPVVATGIYIEDRPLFPHRGLLLDTARNFYPKEDIFRTIDAMAMNKMNVFHWHLTDAQAFPVVLPSERRLAEEGAYGAGMRYEVEDVEEVVEYGMRRGVRVVPEIDMPGELIELIS